MEKELLKAFEAAKKAADGAAADGGPAEEGRCVDALRQLRRVPVAKDLLMATKVGKCLRCLTKHPRGKIKAVASELFQFWRNLVLEEASKEKKNHNPQDRSSKMVEVKSKGANTIGVNKGLDRVLKSASVKVGDIESEHGINDDGPHAKEKVNIVVQTVAEEEKEASVSSPFRPPKSMSTIKCNDPVRDKLRDILVEAFSRVSKETRESNREEVKNILNRVDACDPIHVAVSVECAMFNKLGPTSGAHKVRYRSIMFNLKDNKNTDLRRRVLLGRVLPEELVDMTPEEMASDERKLLNQQIKEKALFECERGGAPEATTDQFKCGRCGQRKTTYYQMQTRSADEPMTTFVTCVNCNNHWKFC